jgi:class 3 adenylate cyclase
VRSARPRPRDLDREPASSLWERISRIGARADDAPAERRRMRVVNQSAVLAFANIMVFAAAYLALGIVDLGVVAVGCAAGALLTLVLQQRGARTIAPVVVLLSANLIVLVAGLRLGAGVGFQNYFFIFASVSFLLCADERMRWALAALPAILFLVVETIGRRSGTIAVPEALRHALVMVSSLSSMAIVAYLISVFRADAEESERLLAMEHARSERLLLNILPSPIAERLKADERSIADGFAEVTVLFSDLVGFTELSQRLSPAELVQLLNRIFYRFDALSDEHGLEKIKTIGDAYMVAGGITDGNVDHADRVARMGLDMLRVIEEVNRETGHSLAIRVGINTGSVVAGVIGKNKFIYDLWGDAVNTASRMESSGVKGRVQVSRATYERLKDRFAFEARGVIAVKGKGEMETFFLERELRAEVA